MAQNICAAAGSCSAQVVGAVLALSTPAPPLEVAAMSFSYGKRHQQVTTLTGRRARHDSFPAVTNN
jgi:hypothetical protein